MQFGYSSGATNDLENQVLMAMGLGYANPGGSIAWQGPTSQGMVDAALNMAYARLCSDIGDIELLTQTLTIPTQPSVWSYTLQNTFGQPPTAIGDRATGSFIIGGKAAAGQTPSITINGHVINYTVLGTDTLSSVTQAFINLINANTVVTSGNQLAPVTPVLNALNTIGLLAQNPGTSGNYAISTNGGSGTITVTVSGATMLGGTAANQPIRTLRRVWYQPLGQLYRLELEPGARLISWEALNRKTGGGYMQPFSYATNPDYCAMDPTRQNLVIFPGPFTAGDQITVEYCPIITANPSIPATQWGPLANPTDLPLLPEDCHQAIWELAVAFLNPKAREYEGGKMYRDLYKESVQKILDNYTRDSAGDAIVFMPKEEVLASSGWAAWIVGNY